MLERGQIEHLGAHITALATVQEPLRPTVAEEARKTAAFFTDRAAQVAYPTFLAQGYQVGSGLAESACKRFGTDRMKGAGMRWTLPGTGFRPPLLPAYTLIRDDLFCGTRRSSSPDDDASISRRLQYIGWYRTSRHNGMRSLE